MARYADIVAYNSRPTIPDGVKNALCWIAGAVMVGIGFTIPFWAILLGLI